MERSNGFSSLGFEVNPYLPRNGDSSMSKSGYAGWNWRRNDEIRLGSSKGLERGKETGRGENRIVKDVDCKGGFEGSEVSSRRCLAGDVKLI
jgi:hypothetical protein